SGLSMARTDELINPGTVGLTASRDRLFWRNSRRALTGRMTAPVAEQISAELVLGHRDDQLDRAVQGAGVLRVLQRIDQDLALGRIDRALHQPRQPGVDRLGGGIANRLGAKRKLG